MPGGYLQGAFMKRTWMIARVVILLGSALAGMAAPAVKSFWGIMIGDAGGRGVAVIGVSQYSPAQMAGVQIRDLVQAINGKAVHSAQEFRDIKNDFPLYTPLKLTLERDGARVETEIRLSGIVPLEVKPIRSEFIIPSVPPPPAPVPRSALDDLDQFNVLDQVIRDPASGRIAVLGHYDDRYNTGPIPYLDLLKTAMAYPKPILDLESKLAGRKVAGDKETWSWGGKEFILGHPSLERERQLLIRLWARACGVTPEELVALYNYVNFGPIQLVPRPEIRAIQSRILTNLGYADAAKELEQVNGGVVQGKPVAEAYLDVLEQIHVAGATVANLRDDLARDRCTWQQAVMKAQGCLLPERSSRDIRNIVMTATNKIRLSEEATRALTKDQLPSNREVVITPRYLDRTSQLTRILYEADYSLKSMKVMPQLFWDIPGSLSEQQYDISKGMNPKKYTQLDKADYTEYWLEPKLVEMTFSPDRKVVSFGSSRMDHKSRVVFREQPAPEDAGLVHFYDDWCAGMVNRYDDYARILPAFHKVREAAKILALADWLLATGAVVDLRDVPQETWDHPDEVAGFWRSDFIYLESVDAGTGYEFYTGHAGFTGGVTFHKSNWTQVTPAPQSETTVANQLALSAGLGEKAVLAAKSGDLENARYLAELSAQAMNGRLPPGALGGLQIPLPQARPVPVTPDNILAQKALLTKTRQQIVTLGHSPAQSQAATQARNQLDLIYTQFFGSPGASNAPQTPPAAPDPRAPRPACAEGALARPDLSPERREYLEGRLQELRGRMQAIDAALRRIAALNAKDVNQLGQLSDDISHAYDQAKERVADLAADVFLGAADMGNETIFEGATRDYEESRNNLEEGLNALRQSRGEAVNPAVLQQADEQIQAFSATREQLETIYQSMAKLHGLNYYTIKGLQYGKSVASVAAEPDLEDKVKGAFLEGVGILLDHPRLAALWKDAHFLRNARFGVVSDAWTYGQYIVDYSIDILSQRQAWGPLVDQLRSNIEANRKAVLALQAKAALAHSEAACLETLIH